MKSVPHGFSLMELAVVLALLGIVAGAVTGLTGWALRRQALLEQQEVREEAVQHGIARVADLIRRSGADPAGRPAIQQGRADTISLRGFLAPEAWRGKVVQISLDQAGRLVSVAQGTSQTPVDLVPGARFQKLNFTYATAGASGSSQTACDSGATAALPCSMVTAVQVTLRALGSQEEESLWVALRNPGGG